jgi:hypothetical protein
MAGLATHALHDVLGGGPGALERGGVQRMNAPLGHADPTEDRQLRELGACEPPAERICAAPRTAAELVVEEQQECTCHRFSAHRQ